MTPARWIATACAALAATGAAADDAGRAQEIVQGRCFICHGADGESSSPAFPRLAGQHAGYVARQLSDYQSGRRQSDTMRGMVQDLSIADFTALGRWAESREPHAHPAGDAEQMRQGRLIFERGIPAKGLAPCTGCHGPAGYGTEFMPRLAGQHALYLVNQLKRFRSRERGNDQGVMQAVSSGLNDIEAAAVSAYISSLK